MNDGFNEAARSATPAATPADTARHKLECLARHICSMPTVADRRAFLASFAKGRRPAAVAELEAEIRRQWESRNARDLG